MSVQQQGPDPLVERAAILLAAALATTCGSSSPADPNGGGDPPDPPPSITASPNGGTYPGDVFVTLSSNEPATIYYTTDGNLPAIGGTTTQSGPAPVTDIPIHGTSNAETTLLLQYFGIDALGNASLVVAGEYEIDELVPQVSQQGADPAPIGILDEAIITWAASDDGTFAVELGGAGTPGSGLVIESGLYAQPGTAVQTAVPGELLQPESGAQQVFVYVTDKAGNLGFAALTVSLRDFGSFDVPAEVIETVVALAPGDPLANRLYVAAASSTEIVVVDTASDEQAGVVELGCEASGLAVLADGARAYAGCAGSISVIDTEALVVDAVLAVPNGALPTGLAATQDGARVYFGSSDGTLLFVDTATEQIAPTAIFDFPIETCRIAITPALVGAKGVVAWQGSGLYGVFVFDAGTGTLFGSAISPTPLSPAGDVAVSSTMAFERGFAGDFLNRLCRLSLNPPGLEQFAAGTTLWGLAPLPGDELLVLTDAEDFELEFRGMQDLAFASSYNLAPPGLPPSVTGLGLPIAVERVVEGNVLVTRCYVVLELGVQGAQLLRVPLATLNL